MAQIRRQHHFRHLATQSDQSIPPFLDHLNSVHIRDPILFTMEQESEGQVSFQMSWLRDLENTCPRACTAKRHTLTGTWTFTPITIQGSCQVWWSVYATELSSPVTSQARSKKYNIYVTPYKQTVSPLRYSTRSSRRNPSNLESSSMKQMPPIRQNSIPYDSHTSRISWRGLTSFVGSSVLARFKSRLSLNRSAPFDKHLWDWRIGYLMRRRKV